MILEDIVAIHRKAPSSLEVLIDSLHISPKTLFSGKVLEIGSIK